MHLTRFGFNSIVAVYLLPLVLIDIVGNTISEGLASDAYYYKAFMDGVLLFFAVYQMMRGAETATRSDAHDRQIDHSDDVVSFENISALEWGYCLVLSCYAAVNWWFLHDLNKHSQGITSVGTLVWSLLSIAVAIMAGIQFYRLKSGAIVELKKKVIQ